MNPVILTSPLSMGFEHSNHGRSTSVWQLHSCPSSSLASTQHAAEAAGAQPSSQQLQSAQEHRSTKVLTKSICLALSVRTAAAWVQPWATWWRMRRSSTLTRRWGRRRWV